MGPFKCPDCGVWWAGFEHRCQTVDTTVWTDTSGSTARCTCSYDPMGHRIPTTALCPVHDIRVTYSTYGNFA